MKIKIVGIIICSIFIITILALLICNWTGAFAESYNISPSDNIPFGLGQVENLDDMSLWVYMNNNNIVRIIDKSKITVVRGQVILDLYGINDSAFPRSIVFDAYNTNGVINDYRFKYNQREYGGGATEEGYLNIEFEWSTSVINMTPQEVFNLPDYFYIYSIKNWTENNTVAVLINIKTYDTRNTDYNDLNIFLKLNIMFESSQSVNLFTEGIVYKGINKMPGSEALSEIYTSAYTNFQYYLQGYRSGFKNGQSASYTEGYDIGFNEGYESGLKDNSAYESGYQSGFNDGLTSQIDNAPAISTAKALFQSVLRILDIKLFGLVSLNTLLAFALVTGLVTFLVHLIRS